MISSFRTHLRLNRWTIFFHSVVSSDITKSGNNTILATTLQTIVKSARQFSAKWIISFSHSSESGERPSLILVPWFPFYFQSLFDTAPDYKNYYISRYEVLKHAISCWEKSSSWTIKINANHLFLFKKGIILKRNYTWHNRTLTLQLKLSIILSKIIILF